MAVVFIPGQVLTKNDLNIFVKNSQSTMFDPYYIVYNIVDSDGQAWSSQKNIAPQKESTGWYWADTTIPSGAAVGAYLIQWTVQDTADSTMQIIEQKFGVVKKQTNIIFTPTIGGVVYYPNQALAEKDLYIMIRNHLGNLSDPYAINYEIFQRISGLDILISPINQIPLRLGVGHYFTNYQIPRDAIPGDYYIRWTFKDTPNGDLNYAIQEFAVVDGSVMIQNPYNEKVRTLIRKLRFLLRDNNPDRNYHFMPPASEETVQGFTQKFGYVWEDEELYEYIDIAVSAVNNVPPLESWTIDNLGTRLYALVLNAAAANALRALAVNWAHDEFAGDVSGVGLNIEKSSKYLSIKENFESAFNSLLTEYKEYGVRVTLGLRQPRYSMGVTSALGPFSRVGVQSRRNYISSDVPMYR